MLRYSNIAQKIPKTPRRIIMVIVLVVLGSLCFTNLMEKGFFESSLNTIILLLALIIIYAIAQFVEYKHLCKNMRDVLTEKEIKFYVLVNCFLVGVAIMFFGTILLVT